MEAKGKTVTQYVIDAHLLKEVFDNIPKKVTIERVCVALGSPWPSTRKIRVPNRLRKLGVSYIREPGNTRDVDMVLNDRPNRKSVLKNVQAVAKLEKIDPDTASVRYITLSAGGSKAFFSRTRKHVHPDETDLRKKATVLGLTGNEGPLAKILQEMSMGKYACQFETIPVRRIMCSKLK